MRYLDVCAGISASTVAWKPLGWTAAAYSEIEAAPRAILTHHYPDTPLHGDFTTIEGHEYGPIDLLVGGTPCQDFSVAGLRAGLDGDRGNLSLEYLRLADRARPRWLVWENVPGVLSIDGGRAFGAILGGMGLLGYGFAYAILDAQYFGVPQRRRRVFVVGYLGDWRRAAAVLFERHSLQGNPAPRREAGKGVAGSLSPGAHPGGFNGQDAYAGQLIPFDTTQITSAANYSRPQPGDPCHPLAAAAHIPAIAHTLTGEGFDASPDGTGRGTPIIPIAFAQNTRDEVRLQGGDGKVVGALAADPGMKQTTYVAFTSKDHGQDAGEIAPTLRAMQGKHANAGGQIAIAHRHSGNAGSWETGDRIDALTAAHDSSAQHTITSGSAVRRLTPRECERLQGFPDDYTLVPYRRGTMADGPRYKALGNSMAVPVMRWIGERIAMVEALATTPPHHEGTHHG